MFSKHIPRFVTSRSFYFFSTLRFSSRFFAFSFFLSFNALMPYCCHVFANANHFRRFFVRCHTLLSPCSSFHFRYHATYTSKSFIFFECRYYFTRWYWLRSFIFLSPRRVSIDVATFFRHFSLLCQRHYVIRHVILIRDVTMLFWYITLIRRRSCLLNHFFVPYACYFIHFTLRYAASRWCAMRRDYIRRFARPRMITHCTPPYTSWHWCRMMLFFFTSSIFHLSIPTPDNHVFSIFHLFPYGSIFFFIIILSPLIFTPTLFFVLIFRAYFFFALLFLLFIILPSIIAPFRCHFTNRLFSFTVSNAFSSLPASFTTPPYFSPPSLTFFAIFYQIIDTTPMHFDFEPLCHHHYRDYFLHAVIFHFFVTDAIVISRPYYATPAFFHFHFSFFIIVIVFRRFLSCCHILNTLILFRSRFHHLRHFFISFSFETLLLHIHSCHEPSATTTKSLPLFLRPYYDTTFREMLWFFVYTTLYNILFSCHVTIAAAATVFSDACHWYYSRLYRHRCYSSPRRHTPRLHYAADITLTTLRSRLLYYYRHFSLFSFVRMFMFFFSLFSCLRLISSS